MKTEQKIRQRLDKLRSRHLQEFVEQCIGRRPCNCVHNEIHIPRPLKYKADEEEFERAPRVSNTMVVTPTKGAPVRLCMYIAPSEEDGVSPVWNGDVCDRDAIAQHCKFFKPKFGTIESVTAKFDDLLADDEHTLKNYPDIAALQWALEDRVYKQKLGFFQRLLYILSVFFIKRRPLPPVLYSGVAKPEDGASEEYWDDSNQNSGT